MFNNLIDILFLGFSINLILSCILTITAFNAVGALMALVFAFINATCIFFLMELEFIGLLFLIIYVGAVSVLFLFSVMLFNLKDVVRVKTTSFILTNLLIFITIAVLFLSLFQYFIFLNPTNNLNVSNLDTIYNFNPSFIPTFVNFNFFEALTNNGIAPASSIFFLGQVIYGRYFLYLILAAIVLLVAMLGAVTLINNPKEQSQMQASLHQVTRSIQINNMK